MIEQCKQALVACKTILDKEFQMEVWNCVWSWFLKFFCNVDLFGEQNGIPGGPYDVVVATLAIHTLAGHNKQEEDVLKEKYR